MELLGVNSILLDACVWTEAAFDRMDVEHVPPPPYELSVAEVGVVTSLKDPVNDCSLFEFDYTALVMTYEASIWMKLIFDSQGFKKSSSYGRCLIVYLLYVSVFVGLVMLLF